MTQFQRILDDSDVEQAVIATLQRWIDTYLRELELQHGDVTPEQVEDDDLQFFKRPVSWALTSEMSKWPDDSLPAIIVVSGGLHDKPVREGRGAFRAPWLLGIAAVVSAKDRDSTRVMAHRYAAAIRAILLQKRSLDQALEGSVRGTEWLDGRNDVVKADAERTVFASRQVFAVEVGEVVFSTGGPHLPDNHPYGEWPTVPDLAHVEIDKDKEPIE